MYLGVLSTRGSKLERERDRRTCGSSYEDIVPDRRGEDGVGEAEQRFTSRSSSQPSPYGHEVWAVSERKGLQIQVAEMSFLRRVWVHPEELGHPDRAQGRAFAHWRRREPVEVVSEV